ncbi:hypothetical protein ONE63_005845 [Megalurothrips usitatus]|uniref:Uncharacterized protein n=1 Tax=Megalurothrips usitatus TaxID=439358 RepID=A0AAV7Y308_9NEOP|nr:hypothetical protein ONE63_005845 [Megalurothrips usitatus]
MASYEGLNPVPKSWPVQRYCRREGSTWINVDDGSGQFTLHAKTGQLMLIQSGTVLESIPLTAHSQTHALVKSDTLLVAARYQSTARKFKIRFMSVLAAQDCMKFLQVYLPVKDVTKPEDNVPTPVGLMFQRLLQTTPAECIPSPNPIPTDFPLEETLHMCILDPSFCDLVSRVAGVLAQFNLASEGME